MYGLPVDVEATIFVGRTLEQICCSENQVALHFGLDLSVVAETKKGARVPAARKDERSVNGMVANQPGDCVDQVCRIDWLGDVELETCLPRRVLIFPTRQGRERNRGCGYSRGPQ